MKLAPHAGRGHLVVGALLVGGALVAALGAIALSLSGLTVLTFFLGVWGGVEVGRYLERSLSGGD